MEEDSPKFNIKFVQLVEKYSAIYDYTNENYANRHIQDEAWSDIAQQLNRTGTACKERWKNIRSAYTRYLRQKSVSEKKRYYLAKYLTFLAPFTKRKQKKSIPSPINMYDEVSEESPHAEDLQIKFEDRDDESEHLLDAIMNESTIVEDTTMSNKTRKQEDPLEKCNTDYFPNKKTCFSEAAEDADLFFLKSLLPDVHRMTDPQKHEFKLKTMQAIGEILYKSPSQNCFSSSVPSHNPLTSSIRCSASPLISPCYNE